MTHSRHLLRGTAEDHKKTQDSITGILLDISTYDLGNIVLLHVTTTFNALNNQLSYASIQNRVLDIPSVCFSSMKLQA